MKSLAFLTLVLTSALTLSACGKAEDWERTAQSESIKANWQKLPDGSSFAAVDEFNKVIPGASSAMRCWPNGKVFDCIHVSEGVGALSMASATRIETDQLFEDIFPSASENYGYSCRHAMDYSESIQRQGKELVSNRPDYSTPKWSKAWVNKYMADNGVDGTKWFDCLQILEAVNKGSVETLSTTSVTRAMAGI